MLIKWDIVKRRLIRDITNHSHAKYRKDVECEEGEAEEEAEEKEKKKKRYGD